MKTVTRKLTNVKLAKIIILLMAPMIFDSCAEQKKDNTP